MTPPPTLPAALGDEIDDPTTETFLLFAQSRPSQDLGYVDKTQTTLELSVAGRDLSIRQSPTLLASDRAEGTTGAVLWKVTPLFAAWMLSHGGDGFLNPGTGLSADAAAAATTTTTTTTTTTVLELGCGISGLLPLVLSPCVGTYVATDVEYVINGGLLRRNFAENRAELKSSRQGKRSRYGEHRPRESRASSKTNVEFLALDWESSVVADLPKHCALKDGSVDVIIACDCIYNDALIPPFVRTCADVCKLRSRSAEQPTVCIIAQQLRSELVFEQWLSAFHESFRVWRVPDDLLTNELRDGSGFCIHVGVVRES